MFNTKTKLLKKQIQRLEDELYKLKQQSEYYNLPADARLIWWPGVRPETLTAKDILRRFDELYDHLGIEREIMPALPEHPKLTKKKKASNA
jgi:hypothetical protein